jgi:7-cyano-7-deazaguanine synthase
VSRVAIGTLAANEFPDAQPDFFAAYAHVLSQGLGTPIEVLAPYTGLHKADLLLRHADLPLQHTLTCAAPRDGLHCGVCMKCEERQTAFREAAVADLTRYARSFA